MSVATLICPTCARPLRQQQMFCEACGARFADRPAPRLPEQPARLRIPGPRRVPMQEILTPKTVPPGARTGRPSGLWVTLIGLVTAAALTFGALTWTGVIGGATPAEKQAQELARAQAELRPALGVFMQTRASFFAAERRYLPAMKQARVAVRGYNEKLADVERRIDEINTASAGRLRTCGNSCPDLDYPAYPRIPHLPAVRQDLKAVVRRTGELHTQLNAIRSTGPLAVSYAELLSAVDLLNQDAQNNLTVLEEMLDRPKGAGLYAGGAARLRIRTLDGNSALPAVRRMNSSLLRLLERTRLPVGSYDLRGGKDAFKGDHSTSVAGTTDR